MVGGEGNESPAPTISERPVESGPSSSTVVVSDSCSPDDEVQGVNDGVRCVYRVSMMVLGVCIGCQ